MTLGLISVLRQVKLCCSKKQVKILLAHLRRSSFLLGTRDHLAVLCVPSLLWVPLKQPLPAVSQIKVAEGKEHRSRSYPRCHTTTSHRILAGMMRNPEIMEWDM